MFDNTTQLIEADRLHTDVCEDVPDILERKDEIQELHMYVKYISFDRRHSIKLVYLSRAIFAELFKNFKALFSPSTEDK